MLIRGKAVKHIYMSQFINVECVESMSHIKVNFNAIGFSSNFSELGIGNTRSTNKITLTFRNLF